MTTDTTTRQTITVTLSTDSEYGEGTQEFLTETGATRRDLDRVAEDLIRETIAAAYPDAEIEIERGNIMSVRIDAPDEIREHVEYLVSQAPNVWDIDEAELVKRING